STHTGRATPNCRTKQTRRSVLGRLSLRDLPQHSGVHLPWCADPNPPPPSMRRKIREREICQAVASSAPITAKVMSQVWYKTLVKTEKALNLWLEDMNCKRVPIN
uniref:HTH CENPB-type domain-containing protein n=1 Tax=Terrapene triunguis TaxID=2587831 RepID=A0A674IYE4_9SAUR